MRRITAIMETTLLDDNRTASITSEDIKRINQLEYDKLDKMSKEELIRIIMGDDCYYNRF